MKRHLVLLLAGLCFCLAQLAYANTQQVLYHNDGLQTSQGNFLYTANEFGVAESFVLQDKARVDGFHFELTLAPPGNPDGVTVGAEITTCTDPMMSCNPFGGPNTMGVWNTTIYGFGTRPLTGSQLIYSYISPFGNQTVWKSFDDLTPGVRLTPGNYYLVLYNFPSFPAAIYWSDPQSAGPSKAWVEDSNGNALQLGESQWFDIVSTTPEPSSLVLLGSALLGIGSFAKRRFLS